MPKGALGPGSNFELCCTAACLPYAEHNTCAGLFAANVAARRRENMTSKTQMSRALSTAVGKAEKSSRSWNLAVVLGAGAAALAAVGVVNYALARRAERGIPRRASSSPSTVCASITSRAGPVPVSCCCTATEQWPVISC